MPVLVVGAGPTGLLAANLLASYGVDALVVDRAVEPLGLPRAILLDDEGFRSLQAVGLDVAMRDRVLWDYGARYYADDGTCFARIEPKVAEYGFPRRNSFHQPDLEAVLERAAKASRHIEVRRGTALTGLEHTGECVIARLENADGSAWDCRAGFVLGCDGARSTVRDLIGARMDGESFRQDWVVVDTRNDPDRDHFTKFFCSAERPAVSIPAPGGGRRYEYMVMPGDDGNTIASHDGVRRTLSRYRAELDDGDILKAAVYTFKAQVADRLVAGRVALLGDAAHLTPPFAGQGMNAGLRDAHNVGWKVALAARGLARPELLASYETERREPIRRMIDFAVTLGSIVMPSSPVQSEVMKVLLNVLNLFPEAKDYVLNMKFKPKPWYRAGAFIAGPETPDDVPTAPGRMLVQPTVTGGAPEESRRLDDVLGPGFALVGVGAETAPALAAWRDPLWDSLGARKAALGFGPEPGDGLWRIEPPFHDLDRVMGKILVVRPDRYVAAIADPAGEADCVAGLKRALCLGE